jgi:hypothetical protein
VRKALGLPITFEDTLEFDVVPQLGDVHRAASIQELASVLRCAFVSSTSSFERVKIPNFNVSHFFSDLDRALNEIEAIPSETVPAVSFGSPGVEAADNQNSRTQVASPVRCNLTVRDFAREVVAFVERELPNVQAAIQAKRVDLLKPVLDRSKELFNRWHVTYPTIVEQYPECTCLIADVVREGAIELGEMNKEERRQLHEKFDKMLQNCRELAK